MLGLTHKPKRKAPHDIHFVVYRSPRTCDAGPTGHSVTAPNHRQALEAFGEAVATGVFSPSNGRRILVTGPDYQVQPDSPEDPLLLGAYAVRAVLSDAEFEAFAAQTARYALEAE